MNAQIAAFLAVDGLINGGIYALLAVGLVLVFRVTRIILVPQGDFIAFGALTLAALQLGQMPGTVWLLLGASGVAFALEIYAALRAGRLRRLPLVCAIYALVPPAIAGVVWWAAPQHFILPVQIALTLALVIPLGPLLYRIAYQPIANASILVLLIVSVAIHFVLSGLALVFFGAEGARTPSFSDAQYAVGDVVVSAQALWIIGASIVLICCLFVFFRYAFFGKALIATAVNRTGARLMGISATMTGMLSFTLAATIGGISGVLIGPLATIFYDTGLIIGLKGFTAAIIGGLVSFPIAAAGAVLIGLLESFASFNASAFKEVIVFSLIIPVLIWRSLSSTHVDEEDDE